MCFSLIHPHPTPSDNKTVLSVLKWHDWARGSYKTQSDGLFAFTSLIDNR